MMRIEKGLAYISMVTILIIINIYVAGKIIFSDMIREQLIGLFFMITSTMMIIYIRKCAERELREKLS